MIDVQAQLRPFLEGKGALNNTRWVVEHSVGMIGDALLPGEKIEQLAVARSPATTIALATDKRMLLLVKGGVRMSLAQMSLGRLTGSDSQEIAYAGLDHVSVRHGLLPGNGAVTFGGPSGSWVLSGVANEFAAAFGAYLSKRLREQARAWPQQQAAAPVELAQPAPSDIARLLRSLADLRTDGLITDAEFQAKKAELLERI
jgi:hypothetical protein